MKRGNKIKFEGPQLDFEEWIQPGITKPHTKVGNPYAHASLKSVEEPGGVIQKDTRLFYQSFGSGSSGNSCYIGTSKGGLIVDAGIRDDAVETILKSNGIRMEMVKGILLTHDHTDHVKYVYKLLRNNKHIKLFCTNRVINGLLRRHNISKRIKEYHVPIFKEIPFNVMDFEVTAFEVPHDGSDNMGFHISFADKNFVLATDMGEIGSRARHYISQANYLVIEANYDAMMLRTGPYPEYLKARIARECGHMDNIATASFLKEIISPELKYIFLCHLSKENNTPEKAYHTIEEALLEAGKKVGTANETLSDHEADVQLMVLPRLEPTRWFVFR